jgi:hypothetical protein
MAFEELLCQEILAEQPSTYPVARTKESDERAEHFVANSREQERSVTHERDTGTSALFLDLLEMLLDRKSDLAAVER